MQPQILLSLIVFANIFHASALPIQYTDASELEARLEPESNEASLFSREYFDFDERDVDQPQLLRRSGVVRNQPPQAATPAIVSHHGIAYAQNMVAATTGIPPTHAVYAMPNGVLHTGGHVAQAVENFHLHNPIGTSPQAMHGSATTPAGTKYPHGFQNFASKPPKTANPPPQVPLIPGFKAGPGNNLHEFPLVSDAGGYHGGKPGAGRIVVEHHPANPTAGVHHDSYQFAGVIGHPATKGGSFGLANRIK